MKKRQQYHDRVVVYSSWSPNDADIGVVDEAHDSHDEEDEEVANDLCRSYW